VINLCANNYLGLSSHPDVVAAARAGLDVRGYGMSSVRFICGTQDIHRTLENKLTEFLGTEDTLLFPSCMDANAGVFEAILGEADVMIADRLVHASIVDGMRLCKAMTDTYKHSDMGHLEEKLQEHQDKRFRMIITDGVFSMDGDIVKLDEIVALAEKYDAMVCVDDSHASGFIGKTGRGSHEHCGVMGRIDVITTTLGKALGGASGGCVSGRRELVEMCRQRARPYLFSNTVAPVIVSGALKVLEILTRTTERRDKLEWNARYWRKLLTEAGFDIKAGDSPIVPVMLYNAKLAQDVARDLFAEGIYVVGFFFPVVPKGQARIRTQLSAAHEKHHLDLGIAAFVKVGKKYDILGKTKNQIIEQYGM
jgi:glycine C-acetyltransferase